MDAPCDHNKDSEGFIHPSCRPRRLDSVPPGGATLALILLALAVLAFQFSEQSWWYAIAGGVLLAACLVLGWRNRAALRSVFRPHHDNDPRKLYNSRNT